MLDVDDGRATLTSAPMRVSQKDDSDCFNDKAEDPSDLFCPVQALVSPNGFLPCSRKMAAIDDRLPLSSRLQSGSGMSGAAK